MASIRIHQDIANFERKRKGFTTRQIVLLVAAVLVFIAVVALFYSVIGLSLMWAVYIGIIPALLLVLAAFFKIANMHFEDFCLYLFAHLSRGRFLFYKTAPLEMYPCIANVRDGLLVVSVDTSAPPTATFKLDKPRKKRGGETREKRKKVQKYAAACRRAGFEHTKRAA